MSLKKAAKKWHSKPWYIAKACEAGQILSAAKVDDEWIIPADMERPPMHIHKEESKPAPVQHGSEYKDSIYKMTMHSFPDFNVMVKEIGGTIYHVYGCFSPTARLTATEKVVHAALRDFNGKVPADVQALANELCEESRENIPTDDQLRKYYLDKFTEIGFSQEEISVLMNKIDEHIETRNRISRGKNIR